jgi:hypothetical protein
MRERERKAKIRKAGGVLETTLNFTGVFLHKT